MKKGSRIMRGLFFFLMSVLPLSLLYSDPYLYKGGDRGFEVLSKTIQIMPEGMLREYDPITVFFPKDTGPAGGGPLDRPSGVIKTTYDHPGEYRWIDARTLQFRPSAPWPALKRFSWTVESVTRDFFTLLSPPVSIYPEKGSTGLDILEEITLTFPSRIPLETLSSIISIEIRPLPGIDTAGSVILGRADYRISALESSSGSPRYLVTFKKPIQGGYKVFLRLALAQDPRLAEYTVTYEFQTRLEFRLSSIGLDNYTLPVSSGGSTYGPAEALQAYNGAAIVLGFTYGLRELSYTQLKEMVTIRPSAEKLKFSVSDNQVYIYGNYKPDTVYEVTVKPAAIRDMTGRMNASRGHSRFYFFIPSGEKFLSWQKSEGIVERYGPKQYPMRGQGVQELDLRIYRIDPLNRNLWPFPEYPVTLDEKLMPPGPGEEPRQNPANVEYLYESDLRKHVSMLGSPAVSRVVSLPPRSAGGFGLDLAPYLDETFGTNRPGTYILGYRALSGTSARSYVRLQVTDHSLSMLYGPNGMWIFVNSYKTALPQSGVRVRLQGYMAERRGKSADWIDLYDGQTDQNGSVYLPRKLKDKYLVPMRLVVSRDEDILVLHPYRSAPVFRGNYWSMQTENWFETLNQDADKPRAEAKAFLFSERPVYKPEDTVYIKGFVRDWKEGNLLIPDTRRDFQVTVKGPGGREWEFPVKISPFGSFNLEFKDKELPTGYYSAVLSGQSDGFGSMSVLATVYFQMEAYRIPTFEVKIQTRDRYPMDKPFKVTLTADYYAGGRVAERPVVWRVSQFPMAWNPAGREGYLFSSDSRYSRLQSRFTERNLVEQEDTLDGNGSASLTLNPLLLVNNMPTRYVIEATVTGPDEDTVTATAEVSAIPGFVIGLKAERFVKQGLTIPVSMLALDPEGAPVTNVAVTARLIQRSWHSYLREASLSGGSPEYVTEQVDNVIEERTVKSAVEAAAFEFKVKEAGIYLVELEARDAIGRLQSVYADVFVAGDTRLAWEKPEENRFRAVPDKDRYKPGETMNILLQSPFSEAKCLAVIERPEGVTYEWLDITGGKGVFTMKIPDNGYPRFPVTFALLSPRVEDQALKGRAMVMDPGKPQTLAAMLMIPVEPSKHIAYVKLSHNKEVQPGGTLSMTVELRDDSQKPMSGEVTLWLVDQAVLSLGGEGNIDPLQAFTRETPHRVYYRDMRSMVFGRVAMEENPGGDYGEDEAGMYKESAPSVSRAMKKDMAEKMADDLLEQATVRKNFRTIAYYNPSVLVDASGKAVIQIPMPDNLTVFAVRAVACDKGGRFGVQKSRVETRLPLALQPLMPRFVRAGDTLSVGALARVVAGEGGKGAARVDVKGGTVLSATNLVSFNWDTNIPSRVTVGVRADSPGYNPSNRDSFKMTVKVSAARLSDKATDAFMVSIPLLPDRDMVKVRTVTNLLKKGDTLAFPAFQYEPRPETIVQTVFATTEYPIIQIVAGMDYNMSYRHECLEQKISRALPALALKTLYKKYGIESLAPGAEALVSDTLEAVAKSRDADGLFAYWPGSSGYVYLTSYVLEFLAEAREAGYTVDSTLYDDTVRVLRRALRSDYSRFIDGYRWDERVAALAALSRAGLFDPTYAQELARNAPYYSLESRARVLLVLQKQKYHDKTLIDSMKKELTSHLVFLLREGKETFAGLSDQGLAWGGEFNAYEIRTLAFMMSALTYGEKLEGRLKLFTDSLVRQGGGYGWGNTWINTAMLLSLRDLLVNVKPTSPSARIGIEAGSGRGMLTLGGAQIATNALFSFNGVGRAVLQDDVPAGVTVRADLRYYPKNPGDEVKAESSGFVVSRGILRVAKNGDITERAYFDAPLKSVSARMGEVFEEHIQVVNPADRYFVAVSAPLAAGFEPLNPNLRTAPPEARPSGRDTMNASYSQYYDDSVTWYFNYLPKGTYSFYYRVRAMTPGSFVAPAAYVEQMYSDTVRGNSPGYRVKVAEPE